MKPTWKELPWGQVDAGKVYDLATSRNLFEDAFQTLEKIVKETSEDDMFWKFFRSQLTSLRPRLRLLRPFISID